MKKILSIFLALCMVVTMIPISAIAAPDASVMVSDDAPVISTHPGDVLVAVGGIASFTVAATGASLIYEWQVDTGSGFTNITDGGVYSGATTATLTITGATAAMDGYQYQAVVTDTVGNNSLSNPATLIIAATTIITAISDDTGVSASDGYTADQTLSISGTSMKNATVRLFKGAEQLGTVMADGVGGWSYDHTGTTLVEGTHSLTASATASGSGITVDTLSPFVVTIDRTPPPAPVISPGAGTTSNATPTLTGTAEPNSWVTLYDSNGTTVLGTGCADAGRTWSIISSALSVGSHTITAKASDLAGNVSTASNVVTIQITAPTQSTPNIQIAYVSEALTGFLPGEQYSINGSASFTVCEGEVFPIYSQWMGGNVSIVHKGDGTTTLDSPAQLLSIPVRPAAPSNSDYMVEHETTAGANDGKLKVTIADCEYRSLNHYSGFWRALTQDEWVENLAPDTYYVRKKAVEGTSLASNISTPIAINAGAPAPAPNLSVDDVTLDTVTVGYMSTAYKDIVITNSGDAQATISNVKTDRPSVFSTHPGSPYVDAGDSSKFWQIRAETDLEVGTYTATITVTYDGGRTASATVSITVNAVGNYTITFYPNGGAVSEASRSVAPGTAVGALPTPTHSGSYSFDGWYTAASGGTQISASTTVNANVTYYAHWTYIGGGGSGGGGGNSSNDSGSSVIVTPPAPDKPNSPTQGEIKVSGTVDGKGNVTVSLTDKTVTDAFDKALADAKKNGNEQNGITLVLSVDTGSKTGSNVTVNLPKMVQDTIIEKKIVNTIVVVDNPDIRIGMDLATVQEINKQAKSDVNITATRTDSSGVTGDAKQAIGSRPVFELKVDYGSGKSVQSFGSGSVSVTIPYTLGANEKAGNVQAVYVDANGKVHWLTNSVYDSVEKVLRFSTDHFSTYGVGYKQTNTAFTDITAHWAKEDIEFVVSRGLFSGTSNTTFSPNTAMTRGMFVTALGRLANADVSGYTKSSFTDVKNNAYYMGYIEWASKNSIVNGTENGKFAPDQSITREQMAVIMQNYAKVIGFTLPKVHTENIFADNAKISAYAKDAVKQMQMSGVISGKNGNLFDPQGTATRAEVSAVLGRFVELAISSDTMQGWTRNGSGQWMYYENGNAVTGKKEIEGSTYTFDQYGVTADVPKNLRYTTYTVQKGDSFWSIARKLGCTMSELERLNNKSRLSLIYPGDVIRVPEK